METKFIKETLINLLKSYTDALSSYSDEQFNFKQADNIWSLGQLYEHLAASGQFFFLKNIQYCLEKRKGQEGGEMNEKGKYIYANNGFPPIKVKVPAGAATQEPIAKSMADYAELFEKLGIKVAEYLPLIETDNGIYKTSHVVFGPLSAKEWLQSFEMHHRHHLRQKTELEGYLTEKSIL